MEQVKFRFTLASVYGIFPTWMKAYGNAKLNYTRTFVLPTRILAPTEKETFFCSTDGRTCILTLSASEWRTLSLEKETNIFIHTVVSFKGFLSEPSISPWCSLCLCMDMVYKTEITSCIRTRCSSCRILLWRSFKGIKTLTSQGRNMFSDFDVA
jgi:hypothetical protein